MLVAQAAHFLRTGPAAGAMVATSSATSALRIGAYARADMAAGGAGAVVLAKATRLVSRPAVILGSGAVVLALPKARARAGAVIRVNTLAQDDVTSAVLEAVVEDGLTVRQALRVLLAINAGKTTISGTNVVFRDLADTKSRVTASMSGSERASITIDPT